MEIAKILTQINKLGGVKIPTSSACCVAIHNLIIPLTSITGRFAAFIPMQQAAFFCVDLQAMGHHKPEHF